MKKTINSSYLAGKLPKGCKLCVKGQKMVLFVTGKCSRGCKFCPLSKLRKNLDVTYSNERKIENFSEIVQEVKAQNAKGCSLTGGDPLLELEKTLDLAKNLKKKFGKKFHIHIYISTKLVDIEKLEKLSKYIDEVRFHPDLEKDLQKEAEKIKLAKSFWKRKNIGLEIPMFPDKINEIIKIVKLTQDTISFLNLNELESGEYSENYMNKTYNLNKDGYTISNSISSGLNLIKKLEKKFPKLNIHLCTSELKNNFQYKNRLKSYKKMKFAKRNEDGLNVYFRCGNTEEIKRIFPKNKYYYDKEKNKIILSPNLVRKILGKIRIERVEEFPTFEREETEVEELD